MTDFQAIADRFEIEALRGEFTDARMMDDYDRLVSLFTPDGGLRIPDAGVRFDSREEIRAGTARLRDLWEFFLQTTHPGVIQVDGDTAVGRAYLQESGRLGDGRSHSNYGVYHDTYRRTPDGWRFTLRVYEIKYYDHSPLTGSTSYSGIAVPAGSDG
ncbi:nuclear transport factor 2 family protein [Kribbella qitaiheensis]|uniref:Nuclear transport factor 2 family protein n=1 Tax=Kribbella qitaiheensis TaxID=1544730 RepID=A0A7G6X6J0_9ACTN|nr:nuclear transport factor 2 family protein [Kribbella qitaiheensis]QNE21855.1 nuclear transport factor 2 family protein [Kribbella qitaiheensis]